VTITNEILEKLIADEAIGEVEPYKNGSEDIIHRHIIDTVQLLSQCENIQIEIADDHIASGFGSFVDIFCYKKDGSSSRVESDRTIIDGINVYLCALAPVAVMGATSKHHSKNAYSYGRLLPEKLNTLPSRGWTDFATEVRTILKRQEYNILETHEMTKPIPFEANISTIFADPPFQIFDAFFHWED
jgi:hypothetical protein